VGGSNLWWGIEPPQPPSGYGPAGGAKISGLDIAELDNSGVV